MRAADAIARRLYEAGCRVAFGMPGGEVLTLVDALEAAGIRFILAKHENAAGFMAEGEHHVDGAPAVLVATVGPGALNAVNVVANAFQDKVPMIFLTGCVDADEAAQYTHQVVDQTAVFTPITKASMRVSANAAALWSTKPSQSPKHPGKARSISIFQSVLRIAQTQDSTIRTTAPALSSPADGPALAQARAWLGAAERPVMIAGLDVLAENASPAVSTFCQRHNIPLITTYKAKGILPETHPLSLGGAGLSPLADKTLLPLVEQADMVICAGYDPVEMRAGWRNVWDPARQNVVEISHEPNQHYMHHSNLNFVASIAPTLEALSSVEPRATWPKGEVATARASLAKAFAPEPEWGPAVVVETCREALPEDTIISADSGAHRILLSQIWTCPTPKGLVQSSGFCTMGCAVPLAIGLKLAAPERPVLGFVGDAGLLMGAGELATAAELGINPIFLVFVDASLALIELKQRQRQLANKGVDFPVSDFKAIAEAFGGEGHTVHNRAELTTALATAQKAERFTLIAAVIERGAYDGKI